MFVHFVVYGAKLFSHSELFIYPTQKVVVDRVVLKCLSVICSVVTQHCNRQDYHNNFEFIILPN